jgi:hypothetical protein
VLLEPGHQRQVVGKAAHERHGGVAVQIDQAGDQHLAGQGEGVRGIVAGMRGKGRQDIENLAVAHHHGVVGQHALGFDGHQPLRQQKKVGGRFHVGLHSHCLREEWQSGAARQGRLKARNIGWCGNLPQA